MNTKASSLREIVIDRCLRSKTRHSMADIMEAVNAELEARGLDTVRSRHTILTDMTYIANHWHIVIKTEIVGRVTYYSYEDPNFSIYNVGLSDEEILQLTCTITMLKRFQGLPNFEWIQQLIDSCEERFQASRPERKFISLEENPYLIGLNNLTPLYDAIAHKKVVDIWYHSFKDTEAQKFSVHPYFLKQFNNRWFLFGYNENVQVISNYPIDRIEKIESSNKVYIDNTFVDFDQFFDDIIGVSREKDDRVEPIRLLVSKKQWPYIETKPIHGSQHIVERRPDGSVVIEINVIVNWELEQSIMSQGEHLIVLSPESLRTKIIERTLNMYSLYQIKS